MALGTVAAIILGSIYALQFAYPSFLPVSTKPVILYYDYENLPFKNSSQFPTIVANTLRHHFNTLMLLVYYNHEMIFNESTVKYFFSYSRSQGLNFVPSYYVESLGDSFNVSGFRWINLDMERIDSNLQPEFYSRISLESVGAEISVSSPYGQHVVYAPSLNIVETYSTTPRFWFLQLTYWHPGHICSIAPWLVHNEQEYDSEKNFCLKYSDGVMVFDYYNLLKSGLN